VAESRYCDFCGCEECRTGVGGHPGLAHAQTEDGRWICNTCWRYDVCVSAKRKAGLFGGPCEDEHGGALPDCGHRPPLTTGWQP
jgi:hypothetical protein